MTVYSLHASTLSRYLIALYHVGQMELTGSGIQLGYRALWRRLRQSHNAVVSRYNVGRTHSCIRLWRIALFSDFKDDGDEDT